MTGGSPQSQRGASFVEVLLAAIVISIALIPMLDAIRVASSGSEDLERRVSLHYRATGQLETLLAEPFGSLAGAADTAGGPTVATSYSDMAGTADRRVVFLSPYDGDNADGDGDPFTGTDPDLMWVRVEIEGTNIAAESLRAR